MSLVPIDEVVHFDVVTSDPTDEGAAVDADSAPTFDVFEESTDTPILDDQTMTKRTSLTGNYRGSFTASAANGFEAGKWYNVIATAIVGGKTGKCVAMRFRVGPAEAVAGVPKVDQHALGGDTQSTTDLKDFADAGYDPATNKVQGVVLTDTVTTYTGNTPQTGDAFARLGAPGGASIAADIATRASQASVDDLPTAAENATAVWADGTRTLTAIDEDNTTLDLDATIRSALGMSSANLDTQLTAIAGYIDTEVAAIISAIATLNNISTADVLTQVNAALQATVADSVPSDGTRPSISSGIYMLVQFLLERSVSGTTMTVKKPDGSTTLFTLTLNDGTSPTSVTRA